MYISSPNLVEIYRKVNYAISTKSSPFLAFCRQFPSSRHSKRDGAQLNSYHEFRAGNDALGQDLELAHRTKLSHRPSRHNTPILSAAEM